MWAGGFLGGGVVGWGGGRRRGGRGGSASGERGEDLRGEGEKERKNGGGGGWKMSMRTDLGFRLGWVWAVGSGSIRRWLMRDPRDMPMVQSERSKPFDDLMTI